MTHQQPPAIPFLTRLLILAMIREYSLLPRLCRQYHAHQLHQGRLFGRIYPDWSTDLPDSEEHSLSARQQTARQLQRRRPLADCEQLLAVAGLARLFAY